MDEQRSDAIDRAILEIKDGRIGNLEGEVYKCEKNLERYEKALHRIIKFTGDILDGFDTDKSVFGLSIIVVAETAKMIAENALEEQ